MKGPNELAFERMIRIAEVLLGVAERPSTRGFLESSLNR